MKPKVEVYFVIYLATIISFFAVESEVRRYKKNQDALLLQASKNQINKLIEISETSSWDRDFSKFKLDVFIDGDYSKDNLKTIASFKFPDDEKAELLNFLTFRTDTLQLKDDAQNMYSLELNTKDFGQYRNVEGEIELEVQYIPQFSKEKMSYWSEVFGNEKIARKIKRILNKQIEEEGYFSIKKDIKKKFKPGGDGIVTKFNLTFDADEKAVLKGIPWKIPISVGGVFKKEDFVLEVITGNQYVDNFRKEHPRSYLFGKGSSGGVIKVAGTRNDGQTAKAEIKLNVFQPQFEKEAVVKEFYLDETFNFDGRIKEVKTDDITASVESGLINGGKLSFGSPNFEIGPFSREGKIEINIFVNGIFINALKRTFEVKKPGPPLVTFQKRDGEKLYFRIATFGKKNSIDGNPIIDEGLRSINSYQKPSKPQDNISYYFYEAILKQPRSQETDVNVEFTVYDDYDAEAIYENIFQYNY